MLDNYTFLRVIQGTAALGLAAGALGPALYVRRHTLVADAVAHSSLPGIAGAFLVCSALGFNPRHPLALMLGAALLGAAAVAIIYYLPRRTRLHPDAVMAATLAAFFSLGIILLRVISRAPLPGKAGIGDYLLGNASTLTLADVRTIAVVGASCVLFLSLVHPWHVACVFDPTTAYPRVRLAIDAAFICALVALIVVGVKVVGVVLLVTVFVAPAVAARQLCHRMLPFIILSSLLGLIGAVVGAALSIRWGVPTGPAIALTDATLALSLALSLRR